MNIKVVTKVKNRDIEKIYRRGISLKEISDDFNNSHSNLIVAAKVNNLIKDLQACLYDDCSIEFIELNTEFGLKVYQRSITFLLIVAIYELYRNVKVTVEHSISKGLFCEVYLGRNLTSIDIKEIEAKMSEIVLEKRPILKKTLPKAEALELFKKSGQAEKVSLIEDLKRELVSVYYCGNTYDYLYGPMLSNTSELSLFALNQYRSGLIIRIPEITNVKIVPEFSPQEKLADIFNEAEKWAKILQCDYVEKLNIKSS
jgi:uridine kinase